MQVQIGVELALTVPKSAVPPHQIITLSPNSLVDTRKIQISDPDLSTLSMRQTRVARSLPSASNTGSLPCHQGEGRKYLLSPSGKLRWARAPSPAIPSLRLCGARERLGDDPAGIAQPPRDTPSLDEFLRPRRLRSL
jgi:hypothetical protein